MAQNLTLLALIQLMLSIFIGVFFMWLTFNLFSNRLKRKCELEEMNVAFAIIIAAVLFSTGYILSGTLSPLLNTLRIISRNNPETGVLLINSSRYVGEFLLIGFLVAMLVNYISISLFIALTPESDEFKEISKNEYKYSLIIAAILIVMALFAREAYIALLDSLVPMPNLPRIF